MGDRTNSPQIRSVADDSGMRSSIAFGDLWSMIRFETTERLSLPA
jgi:hypothetical protein